MRCLWELWACCFSAEIKIVKILIKQTAFFNFNLNFFSNSYVLLSALLSRWMLTI